MRVKKEHISCCFRYMLILLFFPQDGGICNYAKFSLHVTVDNALHMAGAQVYRLGSVVAINHVRLIEKYVLI